MARFPVDALTRGFSRQMYIRWLPMFWAVSCILYSSDEREPPNQRDIGSKKRDLMTASVEPLNGSQMFTVFSGRQEVRKKKEEVPFGSIRIICFVFRFVQCIGFRHKVAQGY